jgi:hypothetical protein
MGIDPGIPEGYEFLLLLEAKVFGPCVDATDRLLERDSRTAHQVSCLGTLLSLMDRLSSCYWGCHAGDHLKEYLVGRACTSSSAAWILVRHGHYDAALAVSRDIGEIANLLLLFGSDAEAFGRWRSCDDHTD